MLALSDWRREIARLYLHVRELAETDARSSWNYFRETRDRLFASHPQSPLEEALKGTFSAIPYFPYNPDWRLIGEAGPLPPGARQDAFTVHVPEGAVSCRPFAVVRFVPPLSAASPGELTLFWIDGYGGGIFLPFSDATCGVECYGGGRYLYDTIKGADLGAHAAGIVLDFNFAYNPSCAYNTRFICPLAPPENRLPFRVGAGELGPAANV